MITPDAFYGGSNDLTIGANLQLTKGHRRLVGITTTAAGLEVSLPDARTIKAGWTRYVIWNRAGGNSFELKAFGGAALPATVSVAPDQAIYCDLIENDTDVGLWVFETKTIGAAPPANPAEVMHPHGGNSGTRRQTRWYQHVINTWNTGSLYPSGNGHSLAVGFGFGPSMVLVGSASGADDQNEADRYTTATDTHEAANNAPANIGSGQGATVSSVGYVLGTLASDDLVQRFEPSPAPLGLWTAVGFATKPTPCDSGGADAIGGNAYVANGDQGGGGSTINAQLERYTPSTNVWSSLSPYAAGGVTRPAVWAENNRIHRLGGQPGGSGTTDSHEDFDAAALTWRSRAVFPTARQAQGSAGPEERSFTFAGDLSDETHEFEAPLNSWFTRAAGPDSTGSINSNTVRAGL